MEYRCEATSVAGFVQQIAVAFIPHGYWFYVQGEVPGHKDVTLIDRKLVAKYGIGISKWARVRRKRQGLANMHYVRYQRTFVLLATRGPHDFFEHERGLIRDVRREPIRVAGYSISLKTDTAGRLRSSVRIHPDTYREMKAYVLDLALRRSIEELSVVMQRLPFEPYAPIRRQLLNVVRAANRERKRAGLEPIPIAALRLRRQVVRVFCAGKSPTTS